MLEVLGGTSRGQDAAALGVPLTAACAPPETDFSAMMYQESIHCHDRGVDPNQNLLTEMQRNACASRIGQVKDLIALNRYEAKSASMKAVQELT